MVVQYAKALAKFIKDQDRDIKVRYIILDCYHPLARFEIMGKRRS